MISRIIKRLMPFLAAAIFCLCLLFISDAGVYAEVRTSSGDDGSVVLRSLIVAEVASRSNEVDARANDVTPGAGEVDSQSEEVSPQSDESEVESRASEVSTPAEEEVEPRTDEVASPVEEEVEVPAEEGPAEEEVLASDEGTVLVKEIAFTGNTVIDTGTLEDLTESYRGKNLTWDEITSLTDTVTVAYQELGYILAKAYVPEQEVEDGVLNITIVEGELGKIEVTGSKYYKKRVITRYFKAQERHRVIKESILERSLLLTKDVPSLETRVVLKKGEVPGTADMILDVTDSAAVTCSIDYNNFGNELVGEDRYGTHIEVTDPWWGSTLAMRGSSGNQRTDSEMASVHWEIPVNSYGTKVTLNYLNGTYFVGRELADIGIEGETKVYGIKLSHPVLQTGTMNMTLSCGYDRKYSKMNVLGDTTSRDKLQVEYFTVDFDNLDRFLGKNIVSMGYYHGKIRLRNTLPNSRYKADPYYDMFKIDAARIQKIYGYLNLMVRGSAQLCGDRLVSIEQFVIGGYGTVRGHDPALLLSDSGYVLSGELMFAPPYIADKMVFGQRIGQMVQMAMFFDYGGIYATRPEPGEDGNNFLSGHGVGLRLFYKDRFKFKFDIGWPLHDTDNTDKNTFYYFMSDFKFF